MTTGRPHPPDVEPVCPNCKADRPLFWTMTDILCFTCRWSRKRTIAKETP